MWCRVTISVELTVEQEAAVAALASRTGVLPFGDVRPRSRGADVPGLGLVRYTRPTLVYPWPRSVRLVRRASGFAIEYTARSAASVFTPLRLILTVMAVLSVGVGVSALTTRDRMWWAEAFSRLGVFDDLSSFMFNGGLVLSGAVACLFASRLWLDLARLRRRGFPKATAIVVPALCSLAGVSIIMVGLVTETANRPLHEISALALGASFAGLVLTSPWLLRRLSRRVHVVTGISSAILFTSTGLFIPGAMTLAAFELVLFGLFFLWLTVISHDVQLRLNAKRGRR